MKLNWNWPLEDKVTLEELENQKIKKELETIRERVSFRLGARMLKEQKSISTKVVKMMLEGITKDLSTLTKN